MDETLSEDDLLSAQFDGAFAYADFLATKLPDKWSVYLAAAKKLRSVRL